MAKDKLKNSFWGKKELNNEDYTEDNLHNPPMDNIKDDLSAYDNNYDYSDFSNDYNDVNNDDYFDSDVNPDYDNDFDNNYSENGYVNQNPEDFEEYDENYLSKDQLYDDQQMDDYMYQNDGQQKNEPLPAEPMISDSEEIDTLLKNISEKLEKLEAKEKQAPANTPFYAQNPMPYVFIPNQSSGNEVILNELAKLREDNYRMQHSQELQRQLSMLKDELNSKLAALDKQNKNTSKKEEQKDSEQAAKNDSVLLEELKKINQKIEQLENKTSNFTSTQDIKQILDQINRLESRLNAKAEETSFSGQYEAEINDIINQVKNISSKNDDVLAYIKSLRNTLGLSTISQTNEKGEKDYSKLEQAYAEFRTSVASDNLYTKITAIKKFNEYIAELPAGEREDIASDFYRIRNKVFGTILTPEIAAELIYNTIAADKEKEIYYYFELKGELDKANSYDLVNVADKFLKLRNKLQNNQYVTYNQNLYNDLIEANSDYEYDQSSLSQERLKRAKEIFSTLRIGDIVPINDYSKFRPSQNFESISDKLNEIHKLIKETDHSVLTELSAKLDSVVNDIKSVFGDKDLSIDNGNINQVLDEITALKENLVVVGEQRHQEILNEISALKNDFANKNISEQDYDIKAQLYALQEEIREKYINNDLAILNSVNEIKDQLSVLSDISELDDVPGVSNEEILNEIKTLKEQLYVQKGEFDPEILDEIRNLKELLATSKKEESYSDIINGLNNIENRLDEINQAEKQDYNTILTSALEVLTHQIDELSEKTQNLGKIDNSELLNEIADLKTQIQSITVPTVVNEGGEKVKLDYSELNEQLDKINNALAGLQNIREDDSNNDLAINVFRDSMIEVLNEITSLKDEVIYQTERNDNIINEINSLRQQLTENSSEYAQNTDAVLTNELNEIKELINTRLNDYEQNKQAYQSILDEFGSLKEMLAQQNTQSMPIAGNIDNTEVLKTLNELKEDLLISKADTDNSFIVETSSIREQLGALKKTLDFNKISEDITELKESIKTNQPQIDTQVIREIIREELRNTRTSELTLGIAAIEKQMAELNQELSRRHEADTATLNFMVQIAAMLDKQQHSDESENSSLINDVNKLKDEINSLKTTKNDKIAEESEKFTKTLSSLKEDLSHIAQIAELDDDNADTNVTMKEAVAELDFNAVKDEKDKEATLKQNDELTQKELLRKQLLEGGLPASSVDEIINSIYPKD